MATVLIKSDGRYEINRKVLREAVLATLAKQGIADVKQEVSVFIVGDRKMRTLNKQYRSVDETTDVLAFPYAVNTTFVESPDKIKQLGDIVISYPQAIQQAAKHDILVDQEMASLTEHGTMHLLGFDHDGLGRWFFA